MNRSESLVALPEHFPDDARRAPEAPGDPAFLDAAEEERGVRLPDVYRAPVVRYDGS